jgi:hypothetical protein
VVVSTAVDMALDTLVRVLRIMAKTPWIKRRWTRPPSRRWPAHAHRARRKDDFVARYGGTELTVVLGEAAASDSLPLAERLTKAVRAIDIERAGAPSREGMGTLPGFPC